MLHSWGLYHINGFEWRTSASATIVKCHSYFCCLSFLYIVLYHYSLLYFKILLSCRIFIQHPRVLEVKVANVGIFKNVLTGRITGNNRLYFWINNCCWKPSKSSHCVQPDSAGCKSVIKMQFSMDKIRQQICYKWRMSANQLSLFTTIPRFYNHWCGSYILFHILKFSILLLV